MVVQDPAVIAQVDHRHEGAATRALTLAHFLLRVTLAHFLLRFPPRPWNDASFTCARRASFTKPAARRSARRRARGFATFIRRENTASVPFGCTVSTWGQRDVPPPRVTYVLLFGCGVRCRMYGPGSISGCPPKSIPPGAGGAIIGGPTPPPGAITPTPPPPPPMSACSAPAVIAGSGPPVGSATPWCRSFSRISSAVPTTGPMPGTRLMALRAILPRNEKRPPAW